jgi:hypothetical protein
MDRVSAPQCCRESCLLVGRFVPSLSDPDHTVWTEDPEVGHSPGEEPIPNVVLEGVYCITQTWKITVRELTDFKKAVSVTVKKQYLMR